MTDEDITAVANRVVADLTSENPGILTSLVSKELCAERSGGIKRAVYGLYVFLSLVMLTLVGGFVTMLVTR